MNEFLKMLKYHMINTFFACFFMFIPSLSFADCAEYKDNVVSILYDNGLSPDYYYLMVAESNCRHGAVSSSGAVGFWQMMPSTMHRYGCRNHHDIICQTHAAAKYIKSLEQRFSGDDVIIAWNMGGHNYIQAKKPTKQALGLLYKYKQLLKYDESK